MNSKPSMMRTIVFPVLVVLIFAACCLGLYMFAPKNDRRPYQPHQIFDPQDTYYGFRWFPTHVDFGPDNDTLLVSLCHVMRDQLCRIGKYHITENRWEILPFADDRTYNAPFFSTDGEWIFYTSAQCDKNANCGGGDYLYKAKPDGSEASLLVGDGYVLHPSISGNGQKLIYWKRPSSNTAYLKIYQLELATGKETVLTQADFGGMPHGKVFFTPDGKRFIFDVSPWASWEGTISCTKPPKVPPEDPKERMSWSYGYLFGVEHRGVRMFTATMDQVPLTKESCSEWEKPWPDSDYYKLLGQYPNYHPEAIDRQGRILYSADLRIKKPAGNPVALAVRPPDPAYNYKTSIHWDAEKRYPFAQLTDEQIRNGEATALLLKQSVESDGYRRGEGYAMFLRQPILDAQDEAAFDGGGCSNSISPDGQRLAFIWGHCGLPSNRSGIGLIGLGQRLNEVKIINWPRLELQPVSYSHP